MINKTVVGALTALTLAAAVVATNTEAKAQANPLELGAAIVGGALYAGASVVGAAVTAPYYVGPYYYTGPYYHSCALVPRYDYAGYWVRTDRVCY